MNYNPKQYRNMNRFISKNANSKQVAVKPGQKKQYKEILEKQEFIETEEAKIKIKQRENFKNEQLKIGVHQQIEKMFNLSNEKDYEPINLDDPETKKILIDNNPMQ